MLIPRRLREKRRGSRAYVIEIDPGMPITVEAYNVLQKGYARVFGVRPSAVAISNVPVRITTIRT